MREHFNCESGNKCATAVAETQFDRVVWMETVILESRFKWYGSKLPQKNHSKFENWKIISKNYKSEKRIEEFRQCYLIKKKKFEQFDSA